MTDPVLLQRRAESPTQPELQDLTTCSESGSAASEESPLHQKLNGRRSGKSMYDEDDPIICGRSDVGSTWSQEEQEQFISYLLLHTQDKQLTQEEIDLVRSEVQQAGLPVECVDRLVEENKKHNEQHEQLLLNKHTNEAFESIEDVDETDNIQAYFSRMSTLKQGGHFPSLNTDAISTFVEEEGSDTHTDDIEVDYDVGYVNKSFNASLAGEAIVQDSSWADSEYAASQISTTIDTRNGYDSTSHAFESLLIGGASYPRDEADYLGTKASMESGEVESTTEPESESDWAPQTTRAGRTYRYGYEHDLSEWKRKANIALWQSNSTSSRSSVGSFFSCQALAEATAADELNGLLLGVKRPPRLQGMTAVQKLLNEGEDRWKRRHQRNQMRHVPDATAAAPKPWQLPYRERCKLNKGYIGVDQFSLMDTAAAEHTADSRDILPWESRDIRQHFLHDQSISLSRNWFGLRRKRGNDPNTDKPAQVNTMGMPTDPSGASVTDLDDCTWTDAPSKTTATKSWKTGDGEVNKTASMSFTSGEASSQSDSQSDDDSTRHTRSGHGRSTTSRSVNDGTSTFYTGEYGSSSGSRLGVDFGSMMTGLDTLTTFSGPPRNDNRYYGVPWMSDDDEFDGESLGISAILDADDDDDYRIKSQGTFTSATTNDNPVSSFSQTSTGAYTHTSDNSSSGTSSSGSFCTEDSQSTSSASYEGSWEDAPECGTLVNVKPKLGERVSRLTHNHTSHLLRSRFRKKYTPKGSLCDHYT